MFCYPGMAIAREKEIKGWRRSKKIALIEGMNPYWHDLAAGWESIYTPDPGVEVVRARSFAARRSG
jgi:hypothetical protein